MDSKIITVQEAAARLRVSRSTVWRWCRDGTFKSAFKIGRNWRLHQAEVEQIIGEGFDNFSEKHSEAQPKNLHAA